MSSRQVGGRSGLRARWCLPLERQSSCRRIGKAMHSLLISAYNYNLITNNFTTETQSAQRTHRDFLAERSVAGCKLWSLRVAGSSAEQPLDRGLLPLLPAVLVACLSPVGRAVRACCDGVRAGSHARMDGHPCAQEIDAEGRSAGVGCNSSSTVWSVLRGKSIICLKRLSIIG